MVCILLVWVYVGVCKRHGDMKFRASSESPSDGTLGLPHTFGFARVIYCASFVTLFVPFFLEVRAVCIRNGRSCLPHFSGWRLLAVHLDSAFLTWPVFDQDLGEQASTGAC